MMTTFIVSRVRAGYEGVVEPYLNILWSRALPYWSLLKSTILRSTAAFIVASFCLYVSAFLFGVLYYYSMPTTYQSYQLSFQYKRSCIQQHRNYVLNGQGNADHVYMKNCFPYAIINLDDSPKKVIDPHQTYAVHLTLQLPESSTNLNVGMFMTTMKYGTRVSSQPASMKYRPLIIRTISTALFWPFFLFNVMESSQTIYVRLFERIHFNFGSQEECTKKSDAGHCQGEELSCKDHRPQENIYAGSDDKFQRNCNQRKAHLQIDYPDIEITAATLHITASFSGLQYLLFQWPIVSFLLGTMMFFTPVLASVLVLLYLIIYIKSAGQSRSIDNHEAEENFESPDTIGCMSGDEEQGHHEACEDDFCDAESAVLLNEVDVIGAFESEKELENKLQDDDTAPKD